MYRLSLSVLLSGLALFSAPSIWAQESGFQTAAPHAVIVDFATGEVLYEKNARLPMAPASMTKIMTADMVFEALENGTVTPDTEFTVSEEAWRRGGGASGSSTMFLNVKSKVRVEDLLRGVIIQSGNDACITLAEGLSGSETAFADKMTQRAQELGLESATFRNATGWPHPEHEISAYDLARLAQHSIKTYPQYYSLYSERSFEWNNIKQGNRNPLLGKFTGADGMKTGSTEISGFGLVGSAMRGEDRRIIVVNGLANKAERQDVSLRLMAAAFDQFKVYDLYDKSETIGKATVYMGKSEGVDVYVDEDIIAGLYRGDRSKISSRMVHKAVPAPVSAGDHIADLIVAVPGREEASYKLYAANDVKAKSMFGKAVTVLLEKIRG